MGTDKLYDTTVERYGVESEQLLMLRDAISILNALGIINRKEYIRWLSKVYPPKITR